MIKNKLQKNKGFVILFAVTISAILLSIALGVANIALREIKFGTSAKDANDAFFAADSGAECALANDKTTSKSFMPLSEGGTGSVECSGVIIPLNDTSPVWSFVVSGLGSEGQSCAKVTVDKTNIITKVIANGYSNGSGACTPGANTVERQLELNY